MSVCSRTYDELIVDAKEWINSISYYHYYYYNFTIKRTNKKWKFKDYKHYTTPVGWYNKNHFAREFSSLPFFFLSFRFFSLLFCYFGIRIQFNRTNLSIRWIWWLAHIHQHSTAQKQKQKHTQKLIGRWCDVIISMNGVREGKNTYQLAESSSRHLASGGPLICARINMLVHRPQMIWIFLFRFWFANNFDFSVHIFSCACFMFFTKLNMLLLCFVVPILIMFI